MAVFRRAFRNVSRRRFRTLLVGFVLALCIAILISTIAGVQSSKQSTQKMVDEVQANTAQQITDIQGSTDEIVAAVQANADKTAALAAQMTLAIQVMAGGGRFGSASSSAFTQANVDAISTLSGVAAVVPSISQRVGGSTETPPSGSPPSGTPPSGSSSSGSTPQPRALNYDYMVNGVPLDSSLVDNYPVLPTVILEGRAPVAGDNNEVLMSQDLESYFDGAGVGDTITVGGSEFKVVGIFYSSSPMDQKAIYMSLENAQDLYDMEGKVSSIQVYADTESDVDTVCSEIEALNSNWMVRSSSDQGMGMFGQSITQTQGSSVTQVQTQVAQQIATAQTAADSQTASLKTHLSKIKSQGMGIIVVSGIIAILMIFGIMFYTVRERTKEIGVLKALGFSNRDVLKQFMLEGFYLGFLGGLIGVALGTATYSFLGRWLVDTDVTVHLQPTYLALVLVAAALAGALGSLYPAWLASRVSPMEALRQG
jgi:putative ABC transport system permease protein